MFLKIARSIARPQAVAILDLVKRSTGLSVNELAKQLKLSYMGAKQYCNELEKKGMLDTFRRPKDIGRPDMLYRLTPKAEAFYPEVGNELSIDLLQSAAQLYGPSAPDKLLFNYFTRQADAYLKKIKGTTLSERVTSLARLRDAEGYCAQVEIDADQNISLVEFHSLFKNIILAFPNVGRLEELMLSRVLGVRVKREEQRISGLVKIIFLLDAPAANFKAPEATAEEESAEETEDPTTGLMAPQLEEVYAEQTADEVVLEEPIPTPEEQSPLEEEEEEMSPVYNMLAPPMMTQAPAPVTPSVTPAAMEIEAPVTNVINPSPEQLAPSMQAKPAAAETIELFEEFRLVS